MGLQSTHTSCPRRLPYLSSYRIFQDLPENNSAHYFKSQAERMFTWELLAALSDKRQGHTSGIIASTEWELPAGSSVTATWPRLPCSERTNTGTAYHRPGHIQVNWTILWIPNLERGSVAMPFHPVHTDCAGYTDGFTLVQFYNPNIGLHRSRHTFSPSCQQVKPH